MLSAAAPADKRMNDHDETLERRGSDLCHEILDVRRLT